MAHNKRIQKETKSAPGWAAVLGPGLLVAATGVGAGDLATGALVGSKLGAAVLWAVVVGAFLKFVLNEGLARWQLATGTTLLEGTAKHVGAAAWIVFPPYLLLWTFGVAAALMSACGVAMHAILPLRPLVESLGVADSGVLEFLDARGDKIVYGVLHSIVAVVLVRRGGYWLFEKVMSVCIAVMFVTVVCTAVAIRPDWSQVARGLFVPSIPDSRGEGLQWTVALMGGVGGTVTVLCYGYWIREEGRDDVEDLRACRIDLTAGYLMTAVFGICMVIIGSRVTVEGGGAGLIVSLADRLEADLGRFGTPARWAFLAGGWGAVFSSLLGVWQSVPYLFADIVGVARRRDGAEPVGVDTHSAAYRFYLYGLATIPMIGLFVSFQVVQKAYAIVGASFIPMLAGVLLILNSRGSLVGAEHKNRWWTNLLLVLTMAFSLAAAVIELQRKFG